MVCPHGFCVGFASGVAPAFTAFSNDLETSSVTNPISKPKDNFEIAEGSKFNPLDLASSIDANFNIIYIQNCVSKLHTDSLFFR